MYLNLTIAVGPPPTHFNTPAIVAPFQDPVEDMDSMLGKPTGSEVGESHEFLRLTNTIWMKEEVQWIGQQSRSTVLIVWKELWLIAMPMKSMIEVSILVEH